MEISQIYEKLKKSIVFIDIEEIKDLDVVCKSVIKKIINNNPDLMNSSTLVKLQAILDRTYEKINIGNWKEVKLYLRKTITIVSYLKLLNTFKCSKIHFVTKEILTNAFKIIDYGLLFGCPLDKEPMLLQKCASILNDVSKENFEFDLRESNININNNSTNISKMNTLDIEIVHCPSMESFYNKYISKETPVVLTGCVDNWPAFTEWQDQNYFLKLAGLRTVPIELGSKYTDSEWTQKLMTLEDFIKNHIYNTNDTTGYLAQYQLFNQIPELKEDISVPEYCYFSEEDENIDINAWYGPKGTVSPLHHDPKKNLLAQVVGEKSIYLFSPSDSEYLYPHEEELLNNTARIDPREPDYEKYPKYSEAKPFHCILKSGQMLYIPPKWWHFVESLSISFSEVMKPAIYTSSMSYPAKGIAMIYSQ